MSTPSPRCGPWTAKTCVASGSGGSAWLAEGPGGNALLKVADSADQRTSLCREVAILSRFHHSQVPALIDSDPDGAWLVRQYVRGEVLSQWAPGRAYSEVVDVVADLAESLACLHEAGIIHADLKGSNVLVGPEGRAHLIDLGISYLPEEPATAGSFRGTLGTAAPEQLQGKTPLPATDIYSLGCLLYQLLTQEAVFPSEDPAAMAYLPLARLPAPLSIACPDLPAALDSLVLDMLARDPANRPQAAGDVAIRLRRSLTVEGPLPVLGMPKARETLRGLVASGARGETGVAVIYGPEGCGRRALVREALQTAGREGLDTYASIREAEEALALRLPGTTVRCLVGDTRDKKIRAIAEKVLSKRLPCLLLLWGTRPVLDLGTLGAVHVSPEPLDLVHVEVLLARHGQPTSRAKTVLRRSKGLPGRVLQQLRPATSENETLDQSERSLLDATSRAAVALPDLARMLCLGEHQLVDLAEPLLDRGLLMEVDDGRALSATEAGQLPNFSSR